MNKKPGKLFSGILLVMLLIIGCAACSNINTADEGLFLGTEGVLQTGKAESPETERNGETESKVSVKENGQYTSRDEVALYLYLYNTLPSNFITKNKARELGWNSKKGNLDEVAPGMSIGGDSFSNREGTLPAAKGRKYKECDINYQGGYRQEERIIYSNDSLIYYTDDHYNTFTLLYGDLDQSDNSGKE